MMVLIYYLVYVCLVVDKSRVSQSHICFSKNKNKKQTVTVTLIILNKIHIRPLQTNGHKGDAGLL